MHDINDVCADVHQVAYRCMRWLLAVGDRRARIQAFFSLVKTKAVVLMVCVHVEGCVRVCVCADCVCV